MQWSHHPTIRQGLAGVFKPHWQQLCRVVKLCILYLKDGKSLGNSHGCHTAPGGAQRGSAVELLGEDFAALQRSRRCSKPFEMGQLETLHFQRVERHKTEWMNRNQQWQKRSISAGYIYTVYTGIHGSCMYDMTTKTWISWGTYSPRQTRKVRYVRLKHRMVCYCFLQVFYMLNFSFGYHFLDIICSSG